MLVIDRIRIPDEYIQWSQREIFCRLHIDSSRDGDNLFLLTLHILRNQYHATVEMGREKSVVGLKTVKGPLTKIGIYL